MRIVLICLFFCFGFMFFVSCSGEDYYVDIFYAGYYLEGDRVHFYINNNLFVYDRYFDYPEEVSDRYLGKIKIEEPFLEVYYKVNDRDTSLVINADSLNKLIFVYSFYKKMKVGTDKDMEYWLVD